MPALSTMLPRRKDAVLACLLGKFQMSGEIIYYCIPTTRPHYKSK